MSSEPPPPPPPPTKAPPSNPPPQQSRQQQQQQQQQQSSSIPPPPPPPTRPKISPPSLIRGKTDTLASSSMLKPALARRATGNSVTFAEISKEPSPNSFLADTAPPPMSAAASTAAAAASKKKPKTPSRTALPPLTLDRVISSQFEDEATTHILAALEAEEMERDNQSRLLGEGIDGMEDYSDDDDDDDENTSPGGMRPTKARTYSTDSFIKNLQMHDQLLQYQVPPPPPPSSSGSSPPRQHRHMTSSLSAGYLPSVPDGSAVEAAFGERLSAYFSEHDDSDDNFVEGIKQSVRKKSSSSDLSHNASLSDGGAGSGDDAGSVVGKQQQQQQQQRLSNERQLSDIREDDEEIEEDSPSSPPTTTNHADRDIMKGTSATRNLTTLAQRLKSLQRGNSLKGISSLRSSFTSSESSSAGEKGSGDKLLDALSNAASKVETRGLWNKLRFEYTDLIAPQMPEIRNRISRLLFFVVVPLLAVATVLFYIFDNPMAGDTGTSVSWWILFVARQALIFEFARVGEVFWVEIMALRSKLFTTAFGPYVALAIIQSKGWPYICIFWPVLDFCFLYGSNEFVMHWLFWQNYLDIFNSINPVNGVTDNAIYLRFLLMSVFVGAVVSLKRLALAIYLGRRTVKHFGQELEKLMAKMILIGEVAHLAKDIENKQTMFPGSLSPDDDEKLVQFRNMIIMEEESSTDGVPSERKTLDSNKSKSASENLSPNDSNATASLETERRARQQSTTSSTKLLHLLDEWEEPESTIQKTAKASVQDLLQFRQAVAFMNDKHPFSRAFGPAHTRELTVESAQKVYDRLMLGFDESSPLPFSVFSVLAIDEDGLLMDAKIKSLIRLFRPDREGKLSRLDFTKSVDTVYKELRLLRASIANSAQIDIAFEKIVNSFFYFFLVIVAVTILGINIWSVFLSINTLVLGFSFLFGSAASNYFEGLLLIFVRRPYDIGDKIATSDPSTDTSATGSSTWFVDRVSLFTTTVRFATTNEVATLSNGSLARLRIINANRSPKATISVIIKFGLETSFQKISIFRTAVENFIKARPREWIALTAFRVTRVEADAGYVEYKILGQHRERWQNIGPILQSKADLSSFCLEVAKKLDMRYESPPMPVNLSASGDIMRGMFDSSDGGAEGVGLSSGQRGRVVKPSFSADDLQDVNNLFEIRKSL
ncbi:hypothetical protein HJC23_005547 [Cyclotella cryptica]|uniref:EF-hand domain-containing protein n=1 Tax=Cyclotella cryptica TaxID=29204 RepID=A0ABD3PXW1_9STRA|eukprot:CCRYP_010645-RA/>CCRYP_010645-RA protein AED:0.17 eAED:0.17 QI:256/1/1/1/0.81/0.66/12/115/1166